MISVRYAGIVERANFVAQFDSIGYDLPGTPAILAEPQEHPPKPSKDHERLRRILDDKRDQLHAGSRGILLRDVSELFMLSEFANFLLSEHFMVIRLFDTRSLRDQMNL